MKIHKNMNNQEIAKLLKAVSAALEVKGENQFRIIAYDRAASSVEHATSEIKDLWDDKKLTDLAGIGSKIAQHLDTLFRKGKVAHFEEIMSGLPAAMFELIQIPEIGPKTALKLCKKLGISKASSAIKRLEKAARDGEISKIEGFGEESEKNILEGIKEYQDRTNRMLLYFAQELADKVINFLKGCPQVKEIYSLGSLRRQTATIGDIDLAAATDSPEKVVEYFISFPEKSQVLEKGKRKASLLLKNGQQIDLRVQEKSSFGSLLQHFTGSKQHNIHLREIAQKKGLSLSEYGVRNLKLTRLPARQEAQSSKPRLAWSKLIKFKDEKSFYNFLGMAWIPPELREDRGEIEAALKRKLPDLVKLEEIKGDLHVHTDFDIETSHDLGQNSGLELVGKAATKGYQYLGLSDHNPSLSQHKENQIIELIKRRNEYIEQLKSNCEKSSEIRVKNLVIFNGLEIDIRPDGNLALPQKALDLLDYVIASVHSSFRLSREKQTERVLRALNQPKVVILGHPTGRKLNEREGIELDWEKIFKFCQKRKILLEINAWPNRLDLPDVLVKEAIEQGIKLVINTDSHAVEHLDLMKYGVAVARRGWAEKTDIINTLPFKEVKSIIKS